LLGERVRVLLERAVLDEVGAPGDDLDVTGHLPVDRVVGVASGAGCAGAAGERDAGDCQQGDPCECLACHVGRSSRFFVDRGTASAASVRVLRGPRVGPPAAPCKGSMSTLSLIVLLHHLPTEIPLIRLFSLAKGESRTAMSG